MPQIEIRPINPTDIPALVEIDHGYKSSYVWQMDRSTNEDQLEIWFREVRLPRPIRVEYPRSNRWLADNLSKVAVVLVALTGEKPIGYIGISNDLSPMTSWVTDLVVHPDIRRQGVASALILAGQEWSVQCRNRRMILEMQSKNYGAIHLAKKLGFELCGYNDQYYSNQDIALFFAQLFR